MNYILQMNGFWRWRRTNSLTNKQADIYYAILDCGNSTGWKESFNIPNSTLIGMCELSKSELHKQRLVLIQKGLIEYSKGKKGSAGVYSIGLLYETNVEINMETNVETNVEINVEDIPKQKETKQNYKEKSIKKELSPKEATVVIDDLSVFTGELRLVVDDWFSYKAEKRQGYKPTGRKRLISEIRNNTQQYGENAVAEVIKQSMSSNYQGIVWDRLKSKGFAGSPKAQVQSRDYSQGEDFLSYAESEGVAIG